MPPRSDDMDANSSSSNAWFKKPTLHPNGAIWLRRVDAIAQLVGVSLLVIGHGMRRSGIQPWEFGTIQILVMAVITFAIGLRFRWSLARYSFSRRHFPTVAAGVLWVIGMVGITILGPVLPDTNGLLTGGPRFWGYVHLSEIILGLYAFTGFAHGLRTAASGAVNPAFLLVASFLALIGVGTIALMLPICRNLPVEEVLRGAPFQTALFTATSASCVTGLVVVDTGTYWSRTGQTVILCLFQIGGLGIMTFGAFLAVIAGRNVHLTEFATLKELFSSDGLEDIRRLIFAILGFTILAEFIGACLLLPLWSELPIPERIWMAVFHSVSAFCNAGFALTENSFVGMGSHWCVWGVLSSLIIVGGFGFAALYNLSQLLKVWFERTFHSGLYHIPTKRVRLTLTTRLVTISTIVLLSGGALGIYLLERTGPNRLEHQISVSDAWFQSVTFRTAGFNTVDLGPLQPPTKLIAILLMVIGASPGSTGGGVKTIVFSLAIVGLLSVLRGRDRVETAGRTIPAVMVNRALAIISVSLLTIMIVTLLIVVFENRPELFIDHIFEATSAVGTVGVSSSVPDLNQPERYISTTQSLTESSRFVIIIAMFLGRVGPLTLLLALTGETLSVRYEYPTERVILG